MMDLPSDSKVVVDLSAVERELSVEWFNPATEETFQGESVIGGELETFNAPFVGDAVLYIHDNKPID
jgi:hypothetical protein